MSAVAELATAAPNAAAAPAWLQRLSSMDRRQRMRLGIGVVLLVVIGFVGIMMGKQAEWRVLYANLPDKDGGAIVAQLGTMNVPYKYSEGGGAIMVPADRVHDVRLRLASQGLPKGSVAGYEIMEGSRFGMTQFQERLNFQRGLEGELTRSIQSLSSVRNARVHLALPNQNGFFREQQKPSASVLVSLHPGAVLDRTQIAGIVHLVASSVPEMQPSAVSVLDDSGKLLSSTPDSANGGAGGGGDALQLQYVQQMEQLYSRRILDILEPVVGRNNVKAQVTADVDFSQTESTSEQHRPNQSSDAAAIRSQQVIESNGGAGGANSAPPAGIPGATTNQPPAPPAAPINGQVNPLTPGAGNSGNGNGGRRESITNYEVDKTVKVTRAGSGNIKRLSAAVVVNYQPPAAGAKDGAAKPLTPQQIEQMTALVRETIGFNKDRGDSVNLMNTPFQVEAADAASELPLWKQPQMLDLARSMAWPVGTLLFAMVVLMGFVRPALRSMQPAALPAGGAAGGGVGRQLNAVLEDAPPRPALPMASPAAELPPVTVEQARLEDARQLAKANPTAVANIVKTWVSGDDAAA